MYLHQVRPGSLTLPDEEARQNRGSRHLYHPRSPSTPLAVAPTASSSMHRSSIPLLQTRRLSTAPRLALCQVRRLRAQLDWAAKQGIAVILHVGHDLPGWAAAAHPELAGRAENASSSAGEPINGYADAITRHFAPCVPRLAGVAPAPAPRAASCAPFLRYGEQRSALLQQHGVAYDIDQSATLRLSNPRPHRQTRPASSASQYTRS